MKNRLISGILFIVLGLFIALGPLSVFPVCGVSGAGDKDMQSSMTAEMPMGDDSSSIEASGGAAAMSSKMKCFWGARAELGIGGLIAVAGLLMILLRSSQVRLGTIACSGAKWDSCTLNPNDFDRSLQQ